MPLTLPQQQIALCEDRFRVAVCGRRFGKTYLAIRELARFARIPNRLCWYIAPTRGQGKGIAWDQLKQRLGSLNWIAKTNESDLICTLRNGSNIQIKSADAADRMRGYSVDFCVLDEFADFDTDLWTAVRPTLSDRQGHALFIGTPKGGRSSWAYDIYANGVNNLADWQSFTYTTLEGGNVPQEEIDAARRDLDERQFRQEYEATWLEASGQIYYAFNRLHNVQDFEITESDLRNIFVGMDHNINPMSAVIFIRKGDELYVIDEITLYSSNTQEMADELRSRYSKSNITVFPDPSGAARKTSSSGATDHSILRNAGFTVKAPRSHTPVRDRINAVNSRLCSADGVRHLFIAPRCKYTIEALERHIYKEGTSQPDKDSGYDHLTDALGYCVDYLFPVRRVTAPYEPQRWSHRIA